MARSSMIDMLGAPKTDLRKKYECKICGIKITSEHCFQLAPENDAYLRILVTNTILDFRTGKTSAQRGYEAYIQFNKQKGIE